MMDLGGAFGLGFCVRARCALWIWSSVSSGSCSSVFSRRSTYLLVEFSSASSGMPKIRMLFLLELPSRSVTFSCIWRVCSSISIITSPVSVFHSSSSAIRSWASTIAVSCIWSSLALSVSLRSISCWRVVISSFISFFNSFFNAVSSCRISCLRSFMSLLILASPTRSISLWS